MAPTIAGLMHRTKEKLETAMQEAYRFSQFASYEETKRTYKVMRIAAEPLPSDDEYREER